MTGNLLAGSAGAAEGTGRSLLSALSQAQLIFVVVLCVVVAALMAAIIAIAVSIHKKRKAAKSAADKDRSEENALSDGRQVEPPAEPIRTADEKITDEAETGTPAESEAEREETPKGLAAEITVTESADDGVDAPVEDILAESTKAAPVDETADNTAAALPPDPIGTGSEPAEDPCGDAGPADEEVSGAESVTDLSDLIVKSEDKDGDGGTVIAGGRRIYVMYNRSFTAKLIQAEESVQERYGILKNELLSYEKVGARMSWANDSFRLGRSTLAKFALRGKTLSLYLAIDPASLENTKYRFENASEVKRYASTPVRLKLRSDRSVKYAKELIAKMLSEKGRVRGEDQCEDYRLPYENTESLIKRGLIKLMATDEVGTEVVKADFGAISREKFKRVTGLEIRESVSVGEAAETISDEVAASLVEQSNEKSVHRGNKKGIVNIDTLSENFAEDETVDLISLKEKGLINRNVGYVKVLARGILNKPLTVKAQDFSLDAVKMIVMTGGAAVMD